MSALEGEGLPSFAAPPVVEVAVGVQFHPLPGLRGIALGPLRERWRSSYPRVEEQPPLPPAIEAEGAQGLPIVLSVGSVPPARHAFADPSGSRAVQVQQDRLSVNWRRVDPADAYPRYLAVREWFRSALTDLVDFAGSEQIGTLLMTQAELAYVNIVDGPADDVLLGHAMPQHHLGAPDVARSLARFTVPGLGAPPVRLYVSVEPEGRWPGRTDQTILTLVMRGAPVSPDLDGTLALLDAAHEHIVMSFAELTSPSLQQTWRRQR